MTLAVCIHSIHIIHTDRFVNWPKSGKSRSPTQNKSQNTSRFYTSIYPKLHPAFHWNLNCCGAAPLELYLTCCSTRDPSLYSHMGWKKSSGHYVKTLSSAACDHRGRKRPLLVWKTPNRLCGNVTVGPFFVVSLSRHIGTALMQKQRRGRNGRHLSSAIQSAFQGGRKMCGGQLCYYHAVSISW